MYSECQLKLINENQDSQNPLFACRIGVSELGIVTAGASFSLFSHARNSCRLMVKSLHSES